MSSKGNHDGHQTIETAFDALKLPPVGLAQNVGSASW
jgi:hypothetical protein